MGDFFNIENPVWQVIEKIADIVILSFLYALLCFPLITIGPATAALYYTIVKVVRRERGYVLTEFFRSFKMNFKTGLLSTIIILGASYILWADYTFAFDYYKKNSLLAIFMISVFVILTIALAFTVLYIFPVLSRFTIKGRQLFKTSFFMSLRHFATTMMHLVILAMAIYLLYRSPVGCFFIPGVTCLIISFRMEEILKRYTPEEEVNEDGTPKDQWYLE